MSEALGAVLPCEDYDTFSGYVLSILGAVPDDGSRFEIEAAGLFIRVVELHDHRIGTAIVCRQSPGKEEAAAR